MKISKANNSIDFEACLQENVAEILKKLYSGQNNNLSETNLLIGVNDINVYNSLTNSGFATTFHEFVSNNFGYDFHQVELVNYTRENWTLVDEQSGIRVFVSNQENHISDSIHGEVSIYKESGSLSKEVYHLESDEKYVYYIGRGDEKRENDIIIENSSTSQYWDMNKYVRSAHAHITYQKNCGFLLWADRDGTAAFGSRTRIIRRGEQSPIDLTNEHVPQLLNDCDIIELGKHVKLLFKMVESK